AFTKSPKGKLVIDKGAEKALLENGKSLLPSGIKAIHDRFNRGNAVILINEDAREVAVGLVNYSSDELNRILGVRTSQIESLLGYKHDDEVIHRDNLVPAPYNK
ncbi:MAG: glutamate 5-kinase, partial [Deltaproteobacteria bacterium]|nr:glutamate 5-kinase [Deltaproteobacteria bacterium]